LIGSVHHLEVDLQAQLRSALEALDVIADEQPAHCQLAFAAPRRR
jgi:hypothetical protein